MKLNQLKPGETARVIGFDATAKPYRRKLMAMGLTLGTDITLLRVAPLGDPLELRVRGFCLVVRKDEARVMELEKLG